MALCFGFIMSCSKGKEQEQEQTFQYSQIIGRWKGTFRVSFNPDKSVSLYSPSVPYTMPDNTVVSYDLFIVGEYDENTRKINFTYGYYLTPNGEEYTNQDYDYWKVERLDDDNMHLYISTPSIDRDGKKYYSTQRFVRLD